MGRIARMAGSVMGMLMLGDAVAYMASPRGHLQVWRWRGAPGWYARFERRARRSRWAGLPLVSLEVLAALGLLRSVERT